jgi:hypothetical protein
MTLLGGAAAPTQRWFSLQPPYKYCDGVNRIWFGLGGNFA